jgi:hypothetical protein
VVMLQLGDNPSNQHYEQVLCYIADVQYDIMLGRPWIAKQEARGTTVSWSKGVVTLPPAQGFGRPIVCLEEGYTKGLQHITYDSDDICEISAAAVTAMAQRKGYEIFPLWL